MPEELLKEFLIESHENLDRLEQDFVALEKNAHDRERLSSVFRTIHTIKGTCGFLGLTRLQAVSHAGESLLSQLRDGRLILDNEITTALFAMVDAIRRILASVEATGGEGAEDSSRIISELERLNGRTSRGPMVGSAPLTMDAVADPRSGEDRRASDDRRGAIAESSLRIEVGLLDTLMTLVDELVLARNELLALAPAQTDVAYDNATARLDLVTAELQATVRKTRLQPIGHLWGKFPRFARDLAAECGKQVRVEMDGRDTTLDKTILEAIKAPLTHVLRNCVDHGIETPDVRQARGKPREGVIRLHAWHEDGQVHVEISDDGNGIDPARVRANAIERGLVSRDQARRLTDADVVRLVFLPGVTTADAVSNLSGRGVGMDVVRTNIERIGGEADVESTLGEGTTLRIRIPIAREPDNAMAELSRMTAELQAMVSRLSSR
jgi:two-component system chemotaxis sensor kinase CheA